MKHPREVVREAYREIIEPSRLCAPVSKLGNFEFSKMPAESTLTKDELDILVHFVARCLELSR